MADSKISALTAATSATDDDLVYLIDDPAGTPTSKKITFSNLQGSMTKVGKVTVTQPATGSTVTVADGATITVNGSATITNGTHSGTNTGDQTITLTSDVTGSGTGSFATTIANDAVTNAKMANMATQTIKGRTTAGTGDPEDLSATQATAILNAFTGDSGSGGVKGLVPAPSAGDAAASKFLKADGTWATSSGSGDVVGPGSATDNAVARFDGTTGKLIQNSAVTIADTSGDITAGKYNTVAISGSSTPTLAVTGTSSISGSNTGDQNLFSTIAVSGQSDVVADSATDTLTLAAGSGITITTNASTDTVTIASSANNTVCLSFIIDGGGSTIATGIAGDLEVPFAGTIQQVTMLADQSGSTVVDIWKDTYANYPPTDADSITASAVPTISSATKSQDSTLTGWTTSITAGDILRFNVDSATTITRVTISLKINKS